METSKDELDTIENLDREIWEQEIKDALEGLRKELAIVRERQVLQMAAAAKARRTKMETLMRVLRRISLATGAFWDEIFCYGTRAE